MSFTEDFKLFCLFFFPLFLDCESLFGWSKKKLQLGFILKMSSTFSLSVGLANM